MPTSLFDRVAGLCDEIGAEKTAAAAEKRAETGIPDPGGAEGATSHPSKKTDDDLQPASEGEQSADNTRIVKETVPDSVDSKSDETHDGVSTAPTDHFQHTDLTSPFANTKDLLQADRQPVARYLRPQRPDSESEVLEAV